MTKPPGILFVLDKERHDYYDVIKNRIATHFKGQLIPIYRNVAEPWQYHDTEIGATVYWLQDPLINRPEEWNKAIALHMEFDPRREINPPTSLPHTRKSIAARMIRQAGLRTPKMVEFSRGTKVEELPGLVLSRGFSYPFFVRENDHHGKEMILVTNEEDLKSYEYPIEHNVTVPVAVEFIDTKDYTNDRYWKFRCMVIGEKCIPFHLQQSREWVTHGINRLKDDIAADSEYSYCNQPVIGDKFFIKAARILGFDTCAFDYTFTKNGVIVVWEVNVFPLIHLLDNPKTDRQHFMNQQTRLVIDELINYYIKRAGEKL
jgi:hypothetical protein